MKYQGWWDRDQFRSYITRCVIRYNGQPVFITDADREEDGYCFFYHLLEDKHREIQGPVYMDNPDIDLSPVPLGLMYWKRRNDINLYNTVVISREPRRMWKMGLSVNNINISSLAMEAKHNLEYEDIIQSHKLGRIILNKYKSFKRCIEISNESEVGSILPFCRTFALRKGNKGEDHTLLYARSDQPVGQVNFRGRYELRNDYGFLMESLEGEIQ